MIRYLGRRHGGLKYERYDGPRPHTIPFPRWCISANLRSLVLSLSFLPSSSATSSLPPPPPARPRRPRPSTFAFSRSWVPRISQPRSDEESESEREAERDATRIPVPFGPTSAHLYRRHLIATIRYLVATSYVCESPGPVCPRHGPGPQF